MNLVNMLDHAIDGKRRVTFVLGLAIEVLSKEDKPADQRVLFVFLRIFGSEVFMALEIR